MGQLEQTSRREEIENEGIQGNAEEMQKRLAKFEEEAKEALEIEGIFKFKMECYITLQ